MDLLNSFSVVAYIDKPIAEFVDAVRREFRPDCPYRAHITVLPPRPLFIDLEEAIEKCRQVLSRFDPFEVRLGEVELFETTQVVKLAVESGISELKTLHDVLNIGPFEQVENFEYVPHITLGQDLPGEKVFQCLQVARRRWAEFSPAPPIYVESLTLVQQTSCDSWKDLAELALARPQPVRR